MNRKSSLPNFGPDERTTVAHVHHDGGRPLPAGMRLQEFVIEGLIGEGGFSIVYLARDTRLQRHVALKEYIPSSLAVRDADRQVRPRSPEQRHTFELGLRSFVNEAQLLASFDHPSLIRVYRFWEENGTAYMAMPYVPAPTLKRWLTAHDAPLDEAWLRALFSSLIDALERIHADRCYHRDIAPDNILLPGDGTGLPRPLLLDFGAARRVIGDATEALTVMLKPGYAPIEQYADGNGARQGPWTDVYALCAVMYAAITRKAPAASASRIIDDEVVPLSRLAAGRYSPSLLAAIDAGMAVRPEQRPQSMRELRALLEGGGAAATEAPRVQAPSRDGRIEPQGWRVAPQPVVGERPAQRAAGSAGNPMRALVLTLGGAMLIGALVLVGWKLLADETLPSSRATTATSRATPPPSAIATAPPGADVAPMPASEPRAAAQEQPAPAQEQPAPAAGASSAAAAAPSTLDSLPALQDILRRADPRLTVIAQADKQAMTIGRDRLRVRVQSAQEGYVYLYFASTDRRVYLLFPNRIDTDNRIEAGRAITLPKAGWNLTAEGPPGTAHVIAVVSPHRRELGGSGLRQGRGIPDFDLRLVERWRPHQSNPFLGLPVCQRLNCSDAWGAALMQIEEVATAARN